MSRVVGVGRFRPLIAVFSLTGLVPFIAQGQSATFELLDLSGAELFQQFCSSCHGEFAHGDGPVAPSLALAVPDLTRISVRRDGSFPTQEVRDIVDGRALVMVHGPRSMPVWGYEFWWEEGADKVAETQARTIIDELVEYLSSIQRTE